MTSLISVLDILAAVSLLVTLWAIRDHRKRGGLPYPPGPRPLPFIGNLLDIPKEFSWLAYNRIAEKYGNILSFHVFGTVIVVLNTAEATKDLLEKRGDICSDRPVVPIFEMYVRWQWVVSSARYGEPYRLARKLLDRGLRPGAVAPHRTMQRSRAHALLNRVLEYPHEWESHIELMQGELILAMTYGYEPQGRNDRKIEIAKQLSSVGSQVALPGALLVNDLPFLRHIPEWLPWFSYKPLARECYNTGQKVMHEPIRFVKECMLNGTAQPSLALDNLQALEGLSETERRRTEQTIAEALGSMYAAGVDTVRFRLDISHTVAALMSFFLAASLYPNVQKKAQEELDAVTGRERLPTFEDRSRLPFVDAVCKEVLRWKPVVPLAIPHAMMEDIVYEGYFIPKGAFHHVLHWQPALIIYRAILHDPSVYPEPDVFRPERFLNPDGSLRDDPILVSTFGYGRRICPGRHFVDATLFITVAALFSVFDISKGQGRPFSYSYTGTIIRYDYTSPVNDRHLIVSISQPKSFPCSIIPRDEKAEALILACKSES
ncbi:cytochrome P450 [Lactifluus volemus]|nr:cytochrome P450 [Lactifluus volemus]